MATGQQRLRQAGTVAAITASALIAPLTFGGPIPSQAATTTTPALDSLANHPAWRLSASDPAVATKIAELKQTLTERGVQYDPAKVGAYRVPTVEGFTTYVTAKPETMTVRPNPDLVEHAPEGDTPVTPAEVLARLVESAPSGAGGVNSRLVTDVFNTVYDVDPGDVTLPDVRETALGMLQINNWLVNDVADGSTVAKAQALIDAASLEAQRLAAKALAEAMLLIGGLPTSDQLVQAVLAQVDELSLTAEQLKQHVLAAVEGLDLNAKIDGIISQLPDREELRAQVQALFDSVIRTAIDLVGAVNIDQIRAEVVAAVDALDVDGRVDALVDQLPAIDPAALTAQVQALAASVVQTAVDAIPTINPPSVDQLKQDALDAVAALDVLGKVDALLRQAPTINPDTFVAQVEGLIDTLAGLVPTNDPVTAVAAIAAVVRAEIDEALIEAGVQPAEDLVVADLIFEVLPIAAAAPPDLVSNVMANPNLPEGTREDDTSDPGWSTRNSDCFRVVTEAYERIVCWQITGQDRDHDSSRNFWQLHTDIAGTSKARWHKRMWGEAKPAPEGASNQRLDALPVPSAEFGGDEGCVTRGETVSVASGSPVQVGYSYYWERETCETYSPKSYSDDGHWASIWTANPSLEWDRWRKIMLKVPVKTPSDKGVSWTLLTGQRTARRR